MNRKNSAFALLLPLLSPAWPLIGCAAPAAHAHSYPVTHTDAEWRRLLGSEAYAVLRQKGTEPAFSSPLYNAHERAVYLCAGCGAALFASDAKFDSGTGWPSFWKPIRAQAVETESDLTLGMVRTEVRCARCGGHLGHVFDDGPKPTGLRYCINGVALKQQVKP